MTEHREGFPEDNPKSHFDQILENVRKADEGYKKKPEWWYWTQSFKDEMEDASDSDLITQDDVENLTASVRDFVQENEAVYSKVRGEVAKMIGEEEYEEWWVEEGE